MITRMTSSGTSSASCSSSKVASDCNVICSQSGSSHTCSTTWFSTATGCSATGTTVTASATVDCCLATAISGTSTGLVKRGTDGGGCDYPCPATMPTASTTGPLADTATAPPNKDALVRRASTSVISNFAGCNLITLRGKNLVYKSE